MVLHRTQKKKYVEDERSNLLIFREEIEVLFG